MTNGFEFGVGLVNLVLLLFILNAVLIKPMKKVVKEREEAARTSMAEAESILNQAKEHLAKYEALDSGLEAEKAAILANAVQNGEDAKVQTAALAAKEAQQVLAKAQSDASAERDQARVLLRRTVSAAAVARAQSLLEQKLDGDAQQNIIENFLSKVGSSRA